MQIFASILKHKISHYLTVHTFTFFSFLILKIKIVIGPKLKDVWEN